MLTRLLWEPSCWDHTFILHVSSSAPNSLPRRFPKLTRKKYGDSHEGNLVKLQAQTRKLRLKGLCDLPKTRELISLPLLLTEGQEVLETGLSR